MIFHESRFASRSMATYKPGVQLKTKSRLLRIRKCCGICDIATLYSHFIHLEQNIVSELTAMTVQINNSCERPIIICSAFSLYATIKRMQIRLLFCLTSYTLS